jgi:hypothetical protein
MREEIYETKEERQVLRGERQEVGKEREKYEVVRREMRDEERVAKVSEENKRRGKSEGN